MFSLSKSLFGHSQDIKCVAELQGTIISCSRDQTTIIHSDPPLTSHLHSHFVNAIATLNPCQAYPQGLIATAGNDKIIYCFNPLDPQNPIYTLIGHDNNICSLKFHQASATLYSSSWDKTGKVWKNGECCFTLTGHEFAVWACCPLDDQITFTASGDKTIKKWQNDKQIKSMNAHTDVVRCLVIDKNNLISCSNDMTIKIWNFDLQLLATLKGHTSFVYQLSVLTTGEIISCGEDASCKVWSDGMLVQSIAHPCVSVWTCVGLENGDFCTGGSDGIVRVFTSVKERQADKDVIEVYEASVKANQTPSGMVGDVDVSKLPDKSSLETPGTKEDQVKMVNQNGVPVAYQWQLGNWHEIGSVVDSTNKKSLNGVDYDYVFDIDVHEGQPAMKLGYNKKDNPYMAAQIFIEDNELPQSYLEEIANFIEKNTERVVIGESLDAGMSDPYTGAGRYVPGQTESTRQQQTLTCIPMVGMTLFQSGKSEAILKKFKELNDKLEVDVKLNDNDLRIIESEQKSQASIDILTRVIQTWPTDDIFPAIDYARLSVSDGVDCSQLIKAVSNVTGDTNQMLALRLLCNLYQHVDITLLCKLKEISKHTKNQNAKIAFITLCANLIVNGMKNVDMMSVVIEFLETDGESGEGMYRGLVVLGTLIYQNVDLKRQAVMMEVNAITGQLFGIGAYKERIETIKRELRFVVEN